MCQLISKEGAGLYNFNPLTGSVYCNRPDQLLNELCCEVSKRLVLLCLDILGSQNNLEYV